MDFTRKERTAVLALGATAGFIIGFGELVSYANGTISIDTAGIAPMVVLVLGMIVSVFWHEAGHKLAARWTGYYTHIAPYPAGLVIGVALAVFTFGWVQFFTPNVADLEANPRARIAKHRKYENWKQQSFIAAAGIFATGLFAAGLQGLFILSGQELFKSLLLGNLWLMIYSLVPFELVNITQLRFFHTIEQLPQSDGLYLLHYSNYAYLFMTTFVLVGSAILYFTESLAIWLGIVVALVMVLATWWKAFKD